MLLLIPGLITAEEVAGLTEVDALTALENWFRGDTHPRNGPPAIGTTSLSAADLFALPGVGSLFPQRRSEGVPEFVP